MTSKKRSKVLVTGGAGFIGSHLSGELLRRGFKVTCLDNFSTGRLKNIEHLPALRVIKADVNNARSLEVIQKEKFDLVFHYAATVGVRRTEENPFAVLDDVKGINNIINFMKRGGGKKLFFASSSEVYGNSTIIPMKEEKGSLGWSPYTVVKLYGEQMLLALWQKHKIPTVSFRFFNVYGPRQAGNGYGFVVAKFIQQALLNTPLTVYGDGQQTRDFVYIDDNIKATLMAAELPETYGAVINIGTGRETHIIDLAKVIIAAAGATTLEPQLVPGRVFEIPRRCADTNKMNQYLKVSCNTPLEVGIEKTIPWFRTQEPATELLPMRKHWMPRLLVPRRKLA